MLKFCYQRFFSAVPVFLGVVTLTFLFSRLIPGDPVDRILGATASQADKQLLRQELQLDMSLPEQYFNYLAGLAQLDFGSSLVSRRPVFEMVAEGLPATFTLAFTAMSLAVVFGVGFAVFSVTFRQKELGALAFVYSLVGLCMPAVILAPVLIWIFALWLDWLPISESGSVFHLILPVMSLVIPLSAVLVRLSRVSMLDVLSEPFIVSLKAKGLGPTAIYFKHALKKAMVPVVTVIGLQTGALLTGTVITETIFDWPGLGTVLYKALQGRDYPVVQGCVLLIALIYVSVNLLTDIVYAWIHPQMRDELLRPGGNKESQ